MRHTNRTYDIAIVIAVVALALLPFVVAANVDGFVANKGQIHDQFNKPNLNVLFLYTSPGLNVQLKKDGFAYDAYSVVERPEDEEAQNPPVFGERPSMDGTKQPQPTNHTYHFHRVDIRFVGGDPNAAIIAEGESADYSNYYTHVTGEAGPDARTIRSIIHHYDPSVRMDGLRAVLVLSEQGCLPCNKAFARFAERHLADTTALLLINAVGTRIDLGPFLDSNERVIMDTDGLIATNGLLHGSGAIMLRAGAVDTIIPIQARDLTNTLEHLASVLQ